MPSNADRLREVFHRFWVEHDWDAERGVFAPDIEWRGMDAIGLDGSKLGPRGVGKFFVDWLEAWEDYSNEAEFHELTPDLVVSKSYFKGRGKGSGIEFETELGQVWEFRDGLVVRQTMYRSYEEALAAGRELAEARSG